ncbi:MAG: hypothetical protein IMZ71_01760 [Chloroflexi bacterium]|nr:hypothetical protein [Chloroflexota bacterium]
MSSASRKEIAYRSLAPAQTGDDDHHQRIRSAVQARLCTQVNAALLDVNIRRVLAGTGLK